jgi:cell wall-associated NlpC family hydrolase
MLQKRNLKTFCMGGLLLWIGIQPTAADELMQLVNDVEVHQSKLATNEEYSSTIVLDNASIERMKRGQSLSSDMPSSNNVVNLDYRSADAILFKAFSVTGTPYRYGGNTPETGLDCSGFVRWVYKESLGVSLPRRSRDMSRVGISIDRSNLLPGDLVFFNTRGAAYSHVGIYVGEEKFIHSPSSGKQVHVAQMGDKYWQKRYQGARRILPQSDIIQASR